MRCAGISSAVLDGMTLTSDGGALRVPLTPGEHRLVVTL
jgi:cyclic beta-1,2-glucan synthetase